MEMSDKKLTTLSAKRTMKQSSNGKNAITGLKFKGSDLDNSHDSKSKAKVSRLINK